jgi:3-oxoacyl-[acyl-carrier protein] reductase
VDLGIAGKVGLVTAASAGLGLGVARALAAEGCGVAINARNSDDLERAAADLPGEIFPLPGDVTDPEAPGRLVAATVERFGRLDILFTNAPGPPAARALEVEDAEMDAALNANLMTPIRLVLEAVPHMRANGWGRIVLNTSIAVKEPIPTLAYSSTARTGLWAWAKTAAADLIDDGITLNLVCPGAHDTERARALGLTGRMGDPADFGKIVACLCSDAAAFVSGTALQIDGAGIAGLL